MINLPTTKIPKTKIEQSVDKMKKPMNLLLIILKNRKTNVLKDAVKNNKLRAVK